MMSTPTTTNPKDARTSTETSMNDADVPQSNGDSSPPPPARTSEVSTDPATQEPDSMAILQKGLTVAPSVSQERKQELLQKARAERQHWVQKVPLPYAAARDPNNIWSTEDRLQPLQTSTVCRRMPVLTKVLSELYGLETQRSTPQEIAARVDQLLEPYLNSSGTSNALEFDEEQVLKEAAEDGNSSTQEYYEFWKTLLKPECALLVQQMRNFLGNLEDADLERWSGALKSFVDSTMDSTIQPHPAWQNCQDWGPVKQSLESFLFGQAKHSLDRLDWSGHFAVTDDEWMERLNQLQFLQPKHLEIQCLTEVSESIDELLRDPVEAMTSIDQYFSPYEKLQRILMVYKGVNTALSAALNSESNTPASERKLPSADDILPTIILTALRAQPPRLLRNLHMIEVFAPQVYLRGEAGYAYTNLYGAAQFLQDLDMETPGSLSISAEEFRKGLEASVSKTKELLSEGCRADSDSAADDAAETSTAIRVQDVREARLQGEMIDVQWAIQHQKQNPETHGVSDEPKAPEPLPDGFSRKYSFLSATPQDIRMSDLPSLLSEYKMMVHVTEQLLVERGTRLAAERKKKEMESNRQLDGTFFGIPGSREKRERSLTS